MTAEGPPLLAPLQVTCTSTDCDSGLHCFALNQTLLKTLDPGMCRSCGELLIDTERLARRDLGDVEYTFQALQQEMWRNHYWHVTIDEPAVAKACRAGRIALEDRALSRLRSSVGRPANGYDGRQTPRVGNVVYYGQHATGTCCRKCIERWHGVPNDRPLTDDELAYFQQLIMLYLEARLPDLPELASPTPRHSRRRRGEVQTHGQQASD